MIRTAWVSLVLFIMAQLGLMACQQQTPPTQVLNQAIQALAPWDFQGSIVGGELVAPTEPFVKSLVGIINMEKGSLCTGTLLNRSHVLTAAHCLPHQVTSLRIFTGLSRKDKTSVLEAVSFVATPQWQTRHSELADRGDLAIIKVTGDLPKEYVSMVFANPSQMKTGDRFLIAGYGRSDGLKKVGAGTLRKTSVLVAEAHHGETEIIFDQRQGQGACHGDSGGPAFMNKEDGIYQWGVTSREYQDTDKNCNQYSIYTKIEPYWDWIQENLQD